MSVNLADEAAIDTAAAESELYYASKGKPRKHRPKNNSDAAEGRAVGKKPHRDEVTCVANMKEFFENTEFGKKLKKITRKTSQRKHGQPVYEVTEKCPEYGLKKGDHVYLDAKHRDHLEVFKGQEPRGVVNLDGSQNIPKTNQARAANRKL